MENRLILEELQRFRLLSNYTSQKTLTENETELAEVLGGLMKGVSFGAKDLSSVARDLESTFQGGAAKAFKQFKITNLGNPNVMMNLLSKDLKSLEKDLVNAIRKDMKGGIIPLQDTRSIAKDISKIIAMRRIMDEQAALVQQALAAGKKAPKLSPARVEQIANEVKASTLQRAGEVKLPTPKGKKPSGTPSGGGQWQPGPGGRKLPPNKNPVVTTSSNGNVVVNITNEIENEIKQIQRMIDGKFGRGSWFKNWAPGKWSWGKVWPLLAAAGAGAAIYGLLSWMFSKNGQQYFPDCIGAKVLLDPSALEKTAKAGLPTNMVYVNDPTNPQINGALFKSDGIGSKTGTVTLPDGSTGDYKHIGDKVQINVSGQGIYIDCSQTIIVQGDDENVNPNPSACSPASDFPFGYYQQNGKVGEVQSCVGAGVDNCMGPNTASAIKSFLSLSQTPTSLTKDIYDQVMSKCRGGNENKPIKEPTQTSGGVIGGDKSKSVEDEDGFDEF